jgi:hypothetical protein
MLTVLPLYPARRRPQYVRNTLLWASAGAMFCYRRGGGCCAPACHRGTRAAPCDKGLGRSEADLTLADPPSVSAEGSANANRVLPDGAFRCRGRGVAAWRPAAGIARNGDLCSPVGPGSPWAVQTKRAAAPFRSAGPATARPSATRARTGAAAEAAAPWSRWPVRARAYQAHEGPASPRGDHS